MHQRRSSSKAVRRTKAENRFHEASVPSLQRGRARNFPVLRTEPPALGQVSLPAFFPEVHSQCNDDAAGAPPTTAGPNRNPPMPPSGPSRPVGRSPSPPHLPPQRDTS